jgi:hypothetical protein
MASATAQELYLLSVMNMNYDQMQLCCYIDMICDSINTGR